MTHFDHARSFLSNALGAESIDEAYPQLEGHRADYFAFDRRVIVELKNLEDDRQASVQAVFDKWRHTFPPAYGTVMLDRLLRKHPYGERVYKEMVDAALASVEPAYKKANRQLRATRKRFTLSESHGLLIFAVDDVYFFDPPGLNYALSRLFAKRTAAGAARYPEIDVVLLLTAAHRYVANGNERIPIMYWISPHTTRPEGLDELARLLLEKWAAFEGMPLIFATNEEVAAMTLQAKKTPTFGM